MRIGINTLFLIPGKVGGSETYLRGLIYGLSKVDKENEYILFTNQENHETFEIKEANFSKQLCRVHARTRIFRIFYEQIILPWQIKNSRIDVLHSPGYVSPIKAKCAEVVTIHDMQYVYHPENIPKAALLYWRHFVPLSARKSDVIVTVSNNSRKDIVNLLVIPEEKVVVTYEASKFSINGFNKAEYIEGSLPSYGIKGQYILSVASLFPHKNLDMLIKSFALIKDKIEHRLLLVGMRKFGTKKVEDTLKKNNISQERVLLLGHVSDSELYSLYKKASLFVLPSLFEGFGIPLVEAMSFGCPVAASDRTSIPEVLGDAGILFNPKDTASIAEAIYTVLTDERLRVNLIKRGRKRSESFSWEKMAQETLKAYQNAYSKYQNKTS